MWISKKKYQELKKRIADLENQVKHQQFTLRMCRKIDLAATELITDYQSSKEKESEKKEQERIEEQNIIIASIGTTNFIFVDGKVYGDYITAFDFHCAGGEMPILNYQAERLPIIGGHDIEGFKCLVNELLNTKYP